MFDCAENHCTQPLFLLRMALWVRACGEQADIVGVQSFLMRRVGDQLRKSLAAIVDDYLDDTPAQGEAFSEENQDRARREIARLARVLHTRSTSHASTAGRATRTASFAGEFQPPLRAARAPGQQGRRGGD